MKKFISWSEKYSVHIDSIDNQHKRLLNLINKTAETFMDGEEEKTKEILVQLEDYTKTHFSAEEALFKNSDYEKIESHLTEHSYFISKLEEFHNSLEEKTPVLSLTMLQFLNDWFLYHIELVDGGYAPYILNK